MSHSLINFVIDLKGQHDPNDSQGLSKPVHDKYVKAVRDSVEMLRENGIPTLWISLIRAMQQLYPGTPQRNPDLVHKLNLADFNPDPQEAFFEKADINAFFDIDDMHGNPELRAYMNAPRKDGSFFKDALFGKPTLRDHLQTLGVDGVTIMGAMAGYCVATNALSAALLGKKTTIFSDLVIGWKDKTYSKVVWHPDNPQYHAGEIKEGLAIIGQDPTSRGFRLSEKPAIDAAINNLDICTFSSFVGAHLMPDDPTRRSSAKNPLSQLRT